MKKEKPESRIQVIDRAATLLDAISRYSMPVTLKALSADTNLAPSTAFRILHSLIDNRFVDRDAAGRYLLSGRLIRLSNNPNTNIDFRKVAIPYMEKLRDKFGETINLTTREGDVVIYVEKAIPNRMMHVQQIIGSRAPLHVTGVGKMMLGMEGEEGITGYAQRTNLPTYTRKTFSRLDTLITECVGCAKQGFAFDNEEAEMGVGCIGVLLHDRYGEVVAGLSVSAPIERRKDEWLDDLIATGKAISAELGFIESKAIAV
ncbi:IclR family transcriptional regulator [Shewanella eurypsychrophilus]|uniref:HTH-type transcriptional repressor AllR n=1 Tax=Shewanella eurypsychrophilus TaxID=2593656 RepID=A0ABX6V5U5_9GAMM|nr:MULTISPECIES: IclR family transcriptional regulator [Shewanella]QFU22721.1 helix-turn-helix domain-containing protein [Shewanella sp. YLB-09]QPG58010.1 IclR family transcriptional regulator [Shewanella eurypsychrophilus]